jgi:splicing factor 3B subunit 2
MNIPQNFLGNKRTSEFPYELNKNRKEKNEELYKQKLKEKKKKKKKDKKANKNKEPNKKDYLLKLLNDESKKKGNNNIKLEYQPIDEDEIPKTMNGLSKYKNNEINSEMQKVMELFEKKIENQNKKIESLTKEKQQKIPQEKIEKDKKENSDDSSSENDKEIIPEESRKKRKKMIKEQGQSSLADLKAKAPYPEVVEPWDTNANDPELLIHFKCMPNTVPVPIHWAQNGKYLQSQRGKVRKPYKLPDYIEATGISRIRLIEIPVHISLQQKTRRRMRPKLGRTDIDYQILYDAFFKYQTKKRLTKLGEVYYEGKETDKRMSKYRPGKLSRTLRNALGISASTIPPFVQNMQRYGPPPAYPFLKIPGVNIPDDDTSAMATPGLWEEPDFRYTKEFIWNFDTDKSHWYHYNKDDMIEEDNNNDDEEKDMDDMGNDQDDLEISDEEKPDISGLFIKQDNKELLQDEIKKDNVNEEYVNNENDKIDEKNKQADIKDVKDKNEEIKEDVNKNNEREKFYKIIEQEKIDLKNNELNPVAFKYNISGINEHKTEKKLENKSEDKEKEEDEEEEDEQDIENINKNIFD